MILTTPSVFCQYTGGYGGGVTMSQKLRTCLDGCCVPTLPTISASSIYNCGPVNTTLRIIGGSLNDAAYWQWFSGSCGSNPIGSGTTINVLPSVTTTYYARAEGGCISSGNCASITIKVFKPTTSNKSITRCNSYLWNGITYTTSGNYTWRGINAAGCDSTATLQLTIQTVSVSSITNSTDALCNNTATGSITVTPTSGVSPFIYRVGTTGNYVSTNTFTNLKAGKYTISILDAIGCPGVTNQVLIGERPAISGLFYKTEVYCYGKPSGSVIVVGKNGSPPFLYRNGNSGSFTNVNTFTNLYSGTYRIYIQDLNGCVGNVVVSLSQPTKLSATHTKTNETCPAAQNGSIIVTPAGGTPPYNYQLGSTGLITNTNTFSKLKAGSYRVYVNDANNCSGYSILTSVGRTAPYCTVPTFGKEVKTTGEKSNPTFGITLFPNPSTSTFTIKMQSSRQETMHLRVMDINGKRRYQNMAKATQPLIFGADFPPGIYEVEVRQGNEVKTLKAVKMR